MRVSYKDLKRYREIAGVFVKYGFSFLVDRLNKDSVAGKIKIFEPKEEIKGLSTGERIRKAFEELGPTFVKIGQILSSRQDIFDKDIINELEKLRDDVEVFDTKDAINIIEEELGNPIDDIFLEFNNDPIGSASIGQVYRAKLKNNEDVIIKVQRPGIEELIKSDINILKRVSKSMRDLVLDYGLDLPKIIDELDEQLKKELDYNFEAVNCRKLGKMFEDVKEVYIPKVYFDYTTKKVLVMEEVKGIRLTDKERLIEEKIDIENIVKIGTRAFILQILEHGFFHADPHPGNIFVINSEQIAFIDFGMVGLVDNDMLDTINTIMLAGINKDVDRIMFILNDKGLIETEVDEDNMKRDITYLIHYYYDLPVNKIRMADVVDESFRFLRMYRVKIPSQLVLLAKTTAILEGTLTDIYPQTSIDYLAKIYVSRYYKRKYNPKNVANDIVASTSRLYYDMKILPRQLRKILKNIERNNMKINIGELRFTKLEDVIISTFIQASMALILAACIISSSLIVSSQNVVKYKLIRYLSLGGFAASFIIGLIFIFSTLKLTHRSKRK